MSTELWHDFLTNRQGRLIHKWDHYFPAYERFFSPWKNRDLVFLEIGVSKGGSLQMWQRYFGPRAKIVGIDIDPNCTRLTSEEGSGIHIRIGNQSDLSFLSNLVTEFGVPDIVLDDGSHMMNDIFQSFSFLYPKMTKNSVYMIEDLHTAYSEGFGGGLNSPSSFINISKKYIDDLNQDILKDTYSISFHRGIVTFEKSSFPIRHTKVGVEK